MAIRCIVVTPERTELDREVDQLVLPMYDGELGILKGRAPLIGRLGFGQLRLSNDANDRYFIDGGFVQVENDVVSILTARAVKPDKLNADEIREELTKALDMPSGSPAAQKLKADAVNRARGMLRTARR